MIGAGKPADGSVPAGEEGEGRPLKFDSWEERCNACRIYARDPEQPGRRVPGEQEPCCTEAKLALIVKETKGEWPCPRRFLEFENADAYMLAMLANNESPFSGQMFDAITADAPPSEVRDLIMLIEGARGDRKVADATERKQARESRERSEERKRRG